MNTNELDFSKLYNISLEDTITFQNHFYSHFSHELITKRINTLLSIDLPDLDTYFGRQKVGTCRAMLPFVKKIYNLAPRNINSPFYISQQHYAEVCGVTQRTISNWIKRLCELGGIIVLDEQNTFETEATLDKYLYCTDFEGYCLYYLINKDRYKIILDYINKIVEDNNKDIDNNISLVEKVVSEPKRNKKIDWDKEYFGLKRQDLHNLCDELNEGLPEFEKMYFEDKKQGTRISSSFCSLPTKEHFGEKRLALEEQYHETYTREDYLDNIFGKDNWVEWDRKASVPFITKLVNKGVITPNDYDLYVDLNGESFESSAERAAYKMPFFMRLYFTKSIEDCKRCAIRTWDEWFYGVPEKSGFKKPTLYGWLDYKGDDAKIDDRYKNKLAAAKAMFTLCMRDTYEKKGSLTKAESHKCIEDYIDNKWAQVEKAIGPRISDVFMYESSLYLQVRKALKNERIIECYDAFYYSKDLEIDIMDIITNIIEGDEMEEKEVTFEEWMKETTLDSDYIEAFKEYVGESETHTIEEWDEEVCTFAEQTEHPEIPEECFLTGVPGEWCQDCPYASGECIRGLF